MMNLRFGVIALGALTATHLALGADPTPSKLPPPATKKGVTFAQDIQPIFKENCFGCHGGERAKGNLRLDSVEGVLKGSKDGKVVIPSNSEKSKLVLAVARVNEREAMPPIMKARGPGGGPPPGGPGGGPPPQGGGPGGPGGPKGPPAKPLTTDQVALIRAWIDQGAN